MSKEGSENDWVEIAMVPQDAEADLIRGFLESEGIEAEIDNRTFHMEPVNFGDMAGIRILSRARDSQRARELLDKRRRDFEKLKADGEE